MHKDISPQKNLLIVISGPSGVGKTTVIKRVMERAGTAGRMRFSISATTRPPRPGERDGVDYHFISKEEFERHVEAGDFLEWAHVHEASYGTLRSELERVAASGKDLLLELDVQGGASIRKSFPDALLIFLSVPDSELRRRLENRPTSLSPEKLRHEINLRLRNAAAEMQQANFYDHIVLNENLDETVKRIISIILAKRSSL